MPTRYLLIVCLFVASSLSAQAVTRTAMAHTNDPGQGGNIGGNGTRRVTFYADGVSLKTALQEVARQSGVSIATSHNDLLARLTVDVKMSGLSAIEAVNTLLRGTEFQVRASSPTRLLVTRGFPIEGRHFSGVITGRVLDAGRKAPVAGATVTLEGTNRSVQTDDKGMFRFDGVELGPQTVHIRLIGYGKVSRHVQVNANASATVDVVLEPSANMLDQVVVTGTTVATELKQVPNAMTVVTAKQIEERGITRIDQLFRGDVPGLFVPNTGSATWLDEVMTFSRGATRLQTNSDIGTGTNVGYGTGFATSGPTTPMRTYVDGVELARPEYLSQIDPRSIERIEILAGPQASTIYGSNAINGVIQIFTKRGTTSRPQLTVSLLSGLVENNFTSALSPVHTYDTQLTGTENRWGYHVGGSWDFTGKWTPSRQTTRVNGYAGGRLQAGPLTADISGRRSLTLNHEIGTTLQPLVNLISTGVYANSGLGSTITGHTDTKDRRLRGNTLGLTASYRPFAWWSHELTGGADESEVEELQLAPRYFAFGNDTLRRLRRSVSTRVSQRYTTTVQLPVTSLATVTMTVGADAWQTDGNSISADVVTMSGTLPNPILTRTKPERNTGGFLQGQLGLRESLFLTYGLRAEWNPNYGNEAQPNLAPRLGLAYTKELGTITTKLRTSYGRSTRPPTGTLKLPAPQTYAPYIAAWGPHDTQLANPDLGPEFQQGGEGGVELYFGTRGSLIVTRYNQTVDGLISSVPNVDSIRSLVANPYAYPAATCVQSPELCDYQYYRQSQYLNVGSIRNQGWEMQGSVSVGPFTTRGTYSWTKSRVIGVTPRYRHLLATTYEPGITYSFLPEHTWSTNLTYTRMGTRLSVVLNGTGQMYTKVNDMSLGMGGHFWAAKPRLPMYQSRMVVPNGFRFANTAYVMTDVNASQQFSSALEGTLQIQNLTDLYRNDMNAGFASLGRQTKVGVRMRW